nr:hypothetical protein [Pectobacterium parmentieri]
MSIKTVCLIDIIYCEIDPFGWVADYWIHYLSGQIQYDRSVIPTAVTRFACAIITRSSGL